MLPSRIMVVVIALLGLGLASFDADGQTPPAPISDEAVKRVVRLALQSIDRAVCDGFNPCAKVTPEELERPPISLDQARSALIAGTRTALAHWCGPDGSRRSVLPMTERLRKMGFNNRQVALMAVIHGIQQSIVSEQLKAKGACDAATRSKIDAQLPKG
jgi:hypothetical protein